MHMDPERYHGIVEYFGRNQGGYKCGYCGGTKAEDSDSGMWAHRLTTLEYQQMIDRGWRRSGKYCYKPDLEKSCCPMYTIRCDALNYNLTKSQKRVIQRVNRFLTTGERKKSFEAMSVDGEEAEACRDVETKTNRSISPSKEEPLIKKICEKASPSRSPLAQEDGHEERNKGDKAKQKRIQRRIQHIMQKESCDESAAKLMMKQRRKVKTGCMKKSLEDRINAIKDVKNVAHKLEIKFVATSNKDYEETFDLSHQVYQKYQMAIHKDELSDCTTKQYKRFLVDNPFQLHRFSKNESSEIPENYGSYHMQYWLDGNIIAVGVLDILPYCISCVYLFYDPEYSFLTLGTYSALREIHLVRQLNKMNSSIKYAYMGYYIHSCKKMRYKGKFKPCDLLCPEAITWHPIETCLPKLDICKYSRLEEDLDAVDQDSLNIKDSDILILNDGEVMTYAIYKTISEKDDENEVYEYAKLIGSKCVSHILLYRS